MSAANVSSSVHRQPITPRCEQLHLTHCDRGESSGRMNFSETHTASAELAHSAFAVAPDDLQESNWVSRGFRLRTAWMHVAVATARRVTEKPQRGWMKDRGQQGQTVMGVRRGVEVEER